MSSRLPTHITRNQVQKLLKSGKIQSNGKPVKASHLVEPGEHITVEYEMQYAPTLYAENIALDIVYEDDYLIVVNKQPGLIVHPGAGNSTGTLVNALIYHCEHLSNDNGLLRPGIVHRLDKDTSGLLISAKDNSIHGNLRSQFSKRTIEKYYYALVWGNFDEDEGEINAPIGRSPKNRKKFTVIDTGKPSLSLYEVVERFEFLTLVRVKLETGRTHQIRVHMTHVNHPIFGDPYYGGRNSKIITLNMRNRQLAARLLGMLNRQALHARRLIFKHPVSDEVMDLRAPMHDDFEQVLNVLREESQYV
ncbi:MAG: RluA family pseudouridine synthase [Candidatus Marinimicrobia bacterium]|nr:RluA family pseudouridine synthase [Candidatus Neomarinimicrobiota bacterium]MBT3576161.1 RluA family pseudouridine synthase [Candidatus Neomarinimicrobiota bacterium]MBT3680580.1 RluA family pseudouridine synthase [Candidatus Neomarinimicrobiota bacterium]MBT3950871.1 RluA family pseudouridine synthase [Candidatus Neomarinimicrobiota bacterium]MBT4251868.1 RluA family pseudouridine synthase [Candidatus Neomarinimicrobiota bacterium]